MSQLKRLLLSGGPLSLALCGLPGVGKTTLAVELAYDPDIREHFCDGILWAGLGRSPNLPAILGNWALAAGAPADVLTSRPSLEERAALVRSAIGSRRMLLIADDAWQAEAALAFKAGGPNCSHLVTSRLTEVALDFAPDHLIVVHELGPQEGLALLDQLAPEAVQTHPAKARELVQSVGGLPLALVLMGRYLHKQGYAAQPRRIQAALTHLEQARARLELAQPRSPVEAAPAALPDTALSLQSAIGLSDTALDPAAQQALRDLALFPPKPNSFSEAAALAVIAAPPQTLDTLVDCGLVEVAAPDRYTLHQTIADFAAVSAGIYEAGDPGRTPARAAASRMAAYYEGLLTHAPGALLALDAELANMLAACRAADRLGDSSALVKLAAALYPFLEPRGLYPICEELLRRAIDSAQAAGNREGLALLTFQLGDLFGRRGEFPAARKTLEQSLSLAQEVNLRPVEAIALYQLGLVCLYTGEMTAGKHHLEQALQRNRELGQRQEEGYTLIALGFASSEFCDFGQARQLLEEALHACRHSGNRRGEGWAHHNLSLVALPQGEFQQAWEHAEACREIYHALADRRGVAWVVYQLGRIHRQMGRYPEARAAFETARQMLSELRDWLGTGFATHNLGLVDLELGALARAEANLREALEIFDKIGCWGYRSQPFHSLGLLHRRAGDHAQARQELEKALHLAREIRHPRGESKLLASLAPVYLNLGDFEAAVGAGQQAVALAAQIGALPTLAYALTALGQVYAASGSADEAAETLRKALELRRKLGQTHLLAEPLSVLARLHMLQGQPEAARLSIAEILKHIDEQKLPAEWAFGLAGNANPEQILATCAGVLEACSDPEAQRLRQLADALSCVAYSPVSHASASARS